MLPERSGLERTGCHECRTVYLPYPYTANEEDAAVTSVAVIVIKRGNHSYDSDFTRWPAAFETRADADSHACRLQGNTKIHLVDVDDQFSSVVATTEGRVFVVSMHSIDPKSAYSDKIRASEYAQSIGGVLHDIAFYPHGCVPKTYKVFRAGCRVRHFKVQGQPLVFSLETWEYERQSSADGYVEGVGLTHAGNGALYSWHRDSDKALSKLLAYAANLRERRAPS